MYNFQNLNDVEFEYLCRDIMQRKLNVKLQRFGSGKDGGIDLTDSLIHKNIVVQVKHYMKTDVNGLIRNLKDEVPKVKSINPQNYYVCCSKELTPEKKKSIYLLFSDYMSSESDIVSITEIGDFLDEEANADILRKHFKLWVDSKNVLSSTISRAVFLDCDALLSRIREQEKLFVKTEFFTTALKQLQKNRILVIVGNPGVGKTVTSEMLICYFAAKGYKTRYTTDGQNLSSLKTAISQDPDESEIVFLDDCFGQAYFKMKETQENELLELIRYIKMHPAKCLLLNSRVTIFNAAKDRSQNLALSVDNDEFGVYVLDMKEMTLIDKARIFHNHLFFRDVPREHIESIRTNKNYISVIKHQNFNPRLIDFVTAKKHFESISSSEYFNFIMRILDDPKDVWKNEYEHRLQDSDRILLTTLYSLTDTSVPYETLMQCYNNRLINTPSISSSINQFSQSLTRLNESMIRIEDRNNQRMLSAINPSVNDFLSSEVSNNPSEKQNVLRSASCVRQYRRLLNDEDYENKVLSLFNDESILSFVFDSERQRDGFITYFCSTHVILNEVYRKHIIAYLKAPESVEIFDNSKVSLVFLLKSCCQYEFCKFYGFETLLRDKDYLEMIISQLDLDDATRFASYIDYLFVGEGREDYLLSIRQLIEEAIEVEVSSVDARDYDINIYEIMSDVEDHSGPKSGDWRDNYDLFEAERQIESLVIEAEYDHLDQILSRLPKDYEMVASEYIKHTRVDGIEKLIDAFFECDDYERDDFEVNYEDIEIDHLFDHPFGKE